MRPLIIIRKFHPDDFSWVIALEREVFNEHDPRMYMEFYETCPEGFLVTEVNGIIIGFVVGLQSGPKEGRVFSLAVDPRFRNMGIGTSLMKRVLEVFRENGLREAVLEVRMSNRRAQQLYQRLGFQPSSVHPHYYNDGEDAVVMKKTLSPLLRIFRSAGWR